LLKSGLKNFLDFFFPIYNVDVVVFVFFINKAIVFFVIKEKEKKKKKSAAKIEGRIATAMNI
jgi:hypothetical protein